MPSERRSSGLLRVPFVRICQTIFENGRSLSGFLVNINILGAYVAAEQGDFPALGELLICRFHTAENETLMPIPASVAWVNAHQPHPVHSLPPGFGIRFEKPADEHKKRLQQIVDDYIKRHPQMR